MSFFINPIKNPNHLRIISSVIRFNLSDPPLKPYHLLRSSSSSSSLFITCSRFSNYYCYSSSSFIDRNQKTLKLTTSSSSSSSSTMGVVSATNEEAIARRFWIKFRRETVFAMYTPFIICLASGKLELDTFRHYISQDVHFLEAFARAYEMAEECADDDDAKATIFELRKNVIHELKMHSSFAQEWGLDPTKVATSNSATIRYTEFLLATASGKVEGEKGLGKIATPFEKTKIAAYTLGAMTPCMRLYAFLGKEIKALMDPGESSHPYKKWIENYSSENFEASALQTEELLDSLSVSLTGEELEVIEKLYHQAMKLEIDFFSAQPIVQRAIFPLYGVLGFLGQRLILFSDFDLTCTVVDSSAILAEIAIITAPKLDQGGQEVVLSRKASVDLRNNWNFLSKQYTEEYEQCIERILPSAKAEEFNYEGLCKAIEQLSDFEKRANLRVIESEVLKGINMEDIKRAGERIILQDGCIGFFQKIVNNEEVTAGVHVLSYCWCGDLIRSAFSSGGLSVLNVHSNEFAYEESISMGEILRKVESPMDKLQAFKDIQKNQNDTCKHLSVYIGDSVGDLLCLLEADVGIVIGSSASLRKVGSQYGISFVPLFSGLVRKQKEFSEDEASCWKGLSGILYTVSSWAEIHAFILGR